MVTRREMVVASVYRMVCRVCVASVVAGSPCAHLEVNEVGQAYEVDQAGNVRPHPYPEVELVTMSAPAPATESLDQQPGGAV